MGQPSFFHDGCIDEAFRLNLFEKDFSIGQIADGARHVRGLTQQFDTAYAPVRGLEQQCRHIARGNGAVYLAMSMCQLPVLWVFPNVGFDFGSGLRF